MGVARGREHAERACARHRRPAARGRRAAARRPSTRLRSSTSRAGSRTISPSTRTRPATISVSAARREATPAWARYLARRIGCHHRGQPRRDRPRPQDMDLQLLDQTLAAHGRAALPRRPGVGVGGRAARRGYEADDQPAAGAARGRWRGRCRSRAWSVRREAHARDGTVKALFATADGRPLEAVLMRYRDGRRSICLSSQSGCPLTCTFCATGAMRFARNLTASEILDQALHFRRHRADRPLRVHGHGRAAAEPRHVLAACERLPDLGITHRRTAISTVGWIPGIERLTEREMPLRLALSLHAADEALRSELMPVNERYPLTRRARRLPRPLRAQAPAGVRRVRDAGRRQRPLRAGAGAGERCSPRWARTRR